jgi:hypothetical protein
MAGIKNTAMWACLNRELVEWYWVAILIVVIVQILLWLFLAPQQGNCTPTTKTVSTEAAAILKVVCKLGYFLGVPVYCRGCAQQVTEI